VDSCVTHPLDILLLRNAEVLFSHQTAQVCWASSHDQAS
jgi:hypothetical protein